MKAWAFPDDWQTHKRNCCSFGCSRGRCLTVKNIGTSHKNDGGSCDDWPLQETLPMKQHRKLGGWDKKSWRRRSFPEDEAVKVSRQRYRSSDGRTVELSWLSCSDVSFGWKWNKFFGGDWGKYGISMWTFQTNMDIPLPFVGANFFPIKSKGYPLSTVSLVSFAGSILTFKGLQYPAS